MAQGEVFERIASETVAGLLAEVAETTGYVPTADIALEYLGEYAPRTGAITKSAGRIVPQRSKIVFMLKAAGALTTNYDLIMARCSNVIQRASVPIPQAWRTRLAATTLPRKAAAAADGLAQKMGGVRCNILGVPKAVEIPVRAGKLLPGAAIIVETRFERELPILLCAPLSGDLWYAHRGSLQGHVLDAADPFKLEDLEQVDIDMQVEPASPGCLDHLIRAARENREVFAEAVAYAGWLAEKERACMRERALDTAVLAELFDANPFEWPTPAGRQSQVSVTILWAWQQASGEWKYDLCTQMLHNALARGRSIAVPTGLQRALVHNALGAPAVPEQDEPDEDDAVMEEAEPPMTAQLRQAAANALISRDSTAAMAALEELLATRADLDMLIPDGRPLLLVATGNEMVDCVALLLEKKADPNTQSLRGWSPLHGACGTGNKELIATLLHAMADPHVTSVSGRTPMSSARLQAAPAKLDGIRQVFAEHGIAESPCERQLWDLRMRKDENEKVWRARLDAELTPHVGHTHVGHTHVGL